MGRLMMASGRHEIFSGLPLIAVSNALWLAGKDTFCGLRVVSFSPGATDILAADILAAFVSSPAEQAALEADLARRGVKPPPVTVNPMLTQASEIIADCLARELSAAAVREAQLRQLLQSMRQEAEETRSALARLSRVTAMAMPSQALEMVFEAESTEGQLAVSGDFRLSVMTGAEIHRVAALALQLEGHGLAPGDALEVALVGLERGQVLASWRVPADAIPARRNWLTLDLPVSLAQTRQTACVTLSGRLGAGAEIVFSRATPADEDLGAPVALRLFRANAPRWSTSPFLVPPAAGAEAVSIPARSWLNARLLHADAPLTTARGDIHLSLPAGAGAMLTFPGVPLEDAHAVIIRLQELDEMEISASVALLPTGFHGDPEATRAAILAGSPQQAVLGDAAVSLFLSDPPAAADVAVALWAGAEPARVRCYGVWIMRRPRNRWAVPPAAFGVAQLPDAIFEDVVLDETYADENYRHLDVTLQSLSDGVWRWSRVKFKLFVERGVAGLEFRPDHREEAVFARWPGVAADKFGPFYKLMGAMQLTEAVAGLPEEQDRRLVGSVRSCLPAVVRSLAARRAIANADVGEWASAARSLGPEAG